MKIIINRSSMEPIYIQIKKRIKAMILEGILKEGDVLPSVRSLAKELATATLTVKKAYDALVSEGYVITIRCKGTYVIKNEFKECKKEVEIDLNVAIQKGRICGISNHEIEELFNSIMQNQ